VDHHKPCILRNHILQLWTHHKILLHHSKPPKDARSLDNYSNVVGDQQLLKKLISHYTRKKVTMYKQITSWTRLELNLSAENPLLVLSARVNNCF
jgi:hypothetical protein